MKKLILIMFILVLLVGVVGAIAWDNIKIYDKENKKITIKNLFGLGETLEEATLISNTYDCTTDCKAEKEITLFEDGVLIDDLRFYRLLNDGTKRLEDPQSYNLNYLTDIGELVCGGKILFTQPNGTEIRQCNTQFNGNRMDWVEYGLGTELSSGTYQVQLIGKKKINRIYDWQINLQGRWIDEWATWGNISDGDDAEVLLLAPENASISSTFAVSFNASANVTGGDNLSNISLFTDIGGGWTLNQTTDIAGPIIDASVIDAHTGTTMAGSNPGTTNYSGVKILTNFPLRLIAATKVGTCDADSLYILSATQGLLSGPHSFTGNTATLSAGFDLDNATEYFVVVNNSDSSGYDARNNAFTFNESDTNVNWNNNAMFNGSDSVGGNVWCVLDVNTSVRTPITSTFFQQNITRNLSLGVTTWNYQACDNTGTCGFAVNNRTVEVISVENSNTFNSSSFETAEETFTVNVTTNGTAPTNAQFIYNGTIHTGATVTNTDGDNYDITKTIDIPQGIGTTSFNFNFTISGNLMTTSTQNQVINLTNFTFCNVALPYINISFKNETTAEEFITAEIDADWNYWLGSGTEFKTLTHTNTSENPSYDFCLTTTDNRTLNTNVSLTYDNSISEQRNFASSFTLTNTTTNQTLFLLPTSEGLFVTFQTVTIAEQVISGVAANVTKSGTLIETGITDDAGLVVFFLDPDTTYVFSFFKTGFDIVTTTLKPTQSSFTITMGSEVVAVENDTTKGINYLIRPIASVLENNTETNFNLTFSSVFWSVDVFGFALKNSTGDIFNVTSSITGSGGFLIRTLNTGDNADIIMEIFWTIDGNQTNITRTWLVIDTSDEGFSIKTFFDDLGTYLNSGIFGLTSFGLGIIIFGIILLVTGILAARFGNIITNPPGISLIIFSLVLFFDVGLGIMPNPVNAVPNFPTIFMAVIFLGTLLAEAIK